MAPAQIELEHLKPSRIPAGELICNIFMLKEKISLHDPLASPWWGGCERLTKPYSIASFWQLPKLRDGQPWKGKLWSDGTEAPGE
jgi:hypothetical protein